MSVELKKLMKLFLAKFLMCCGIGYVSLLYCYNFLCVDAHVLNAYSFLITLSYIIISVVNLSVSIYSLVHYNVLLKGVSVVLSVFFGFCFYLTYALYGDAALNAFLLSVILIILSFLKFLKDDTPKYLGVAVDVLRILFVLSYVSMNSSFLIRQVISFIYIICMFVLSHFYYCQATSLVEQNCNILDNASDFLLYNILTIVFASFFNFLIFL